MCSWATGLRGACAGALEHFLPSVCPWPRRITLHRLRRRLGSQSASGLRVRRCETSTASGAMASLFSVMGHSWRVYPARAAPSKATSRRRNCSGLVCLSEKSRPTCSEASRFAARVASWNQRSGRPDVYRWNSHPTLRSRRPGWPSLLRGQLGSRTTAARLPSSFDEPILSRAVSHAIRARRPARRWRTP